MLPVGAVLRIHGRRFGVEQVGLRHVTRLFRGAALFVEFPGGRFVCAEGWRCRQAHEKAEYSCNDPHWKYDAERGQDVIPIPPITVEIRLSGDYSPA